MKTNEARIFLNQLKDVIMALTHLGFPRAPSSVPVVDLKSEADQNIVEDIGIEALQSIEAIFECVQGIELYLDKSMSGDAEVLSAILKFLYGFSFKHIFSDGATYIEIQWPNENEDIVTVKSAAPRNKRNWGALNRWKDIKDTEPSEVYGF